MARRRVRRRRPQVSWGVIAWFVGLALIGVAAGVYSFASITYRVAVGPNEGEGQRLFAASSPIIAGEGRFLRLSAVATPDFQAASKALEAGDVDLAIIRPDIAIPANGRTIVVLRREPVLVIVPANSKIDKVADLKGKAIGIVMGAGHNPAVLDTLLSYYEVPQQDISRVTLRPDEVAAAIRQKRIAAVFVVGPLGPGRVSEVVAAVAKAGGGAPEFLAVKEAEAIARRWPTVEKLEIARGSLQGSPPVPDETITTIAVTYRLVARQSLYDWPAGELARLLLTNKSRISADLPFAHQIESPDTDKDAVLPAHSGAAAYVSGEQTSFYDTFESLFWMGWMLCTLLGVSYAAIRSRMNRLRNDATTEATDRALAMLSEARQAAPGELDELEEEVTEILEDSLRRRAQDQIDEERFRFLCLTLGHVRDAIDRRRSVPRKRVLKAAKG
jgi:TRAP-type uncharacterized transport system substrate-binding protein